MFSGVARYNILAGRVEISAVQADSLPRFWALLLKRMQWPVPPKAADTRILESISSPDGRDVLRALATETASIITLARMAHDEDKQSRRAMQEQIAHGNSAEDEFNDDVGDIL